MERGCEHALGIPLSSQCCACPRSYRYVLHGSVTVESYVVEVLKLKGKYRTEVTEEPFILKAQLTEILTHFLSNWDADAADWSSWAPELVAFFHITGV